MRKKIKCLKHLLFLFYVMWGLKYLQNRIRGWDMGVCVCVCVCVKTKCRTPSSTKSLFLYFKREQQQQRFSECQSGVQPSQPRATLESGLALDQMVILVSAEFTHSWLYSVSSQCLHHSLYHSASSVRNIEKEIKNCVFTNSIWIHFAKRWLLA